MALYRKGVKPLFKITMINFTYAFMRHVAPMS